ncbi:hypothetical protein BKA65DRAFT_161432 [Rhexocercosporidium sp. MPI-PUGE-AT-0058]|nr:hypothetical protein BKA65DRAFT_161432 [Rhexocercosporidium sp. MPI-PUGE-AT-0058]
MSTPACVSCQESLSCSDSPLSVTANIIGILTFTGALMISTHVYFDKMINAERNILEMMSMLEMKFGDFQHLAAKLEIELRRGFGGGELDHRVIAALRGAERSLDETHRLLDRLRPDSYDRGNRLWLRAKFMQREEMIRGAMAKMETGMTTLREVANDIFSR